jgi:hypothetical protein
MNHVFAWPVGQGQGHPKRLRYALAYAAAATAGGMALGAVLAAGVTLVNLLPSAAVWPIAAAVAFLAVCLQFTGRMGILPERRVQVPSHWLTRSPWWYSLAFGGTLGFGLLTFLHHAAWYAVIAAVLARGSPELALVAGLAFGATRGLGPLVSRVLARTPEAAATSMRVLAGARFKVTSRLVLASAGALLVLNTVTYRSML